MPKYKHMRITKRIKTVSEDRLDSFLDFEVR